jgi:hypothetical protein
MHACVHAALRAPCSSVVRVHMCASLYVCMYLHLNVSMYVFMHVCVALSAFLTSIHLHTSQVSCQHTYIYTYVHTCTSTHINITQDSLTYSLWHDIGPVNFISRSVKFGHTEHHFAEVFLRQLPDYSHTSRYLHMCVCVCVYLCVCVCLYVCMYINIYVFIYIYIYIYISVYMYRHMNVCIYASNVA